MYLAQRNRKTGGKKAAAHFSVSLKLMKKKETEVLITFTLHSLVKVPQSGGWDFRSKTGANHPKGAD
jgi:hypothetical protein